MTMRLRVLAFATWGLAGSLVIWLVKGEDPAIERAVRAESTAVAALDLSAPFVAAYDVHAIPHFTLNEGWWLHLRLRVDTLRECAAYQIRREVTPAAGGLPLVQVLKVAPWGDVGESARAVPPPMFLGDVEPGRYQIVTRASCLNEVGGAMVVDGSPVDTPAVTFLIPSIAGTGWKPGE